MEYIKINSEIVMDVKVDDKNITGQMVNDMSSQELKNFENRLLSKAKENNFTTEKKVHPIYGNVFSLIAEDDEVEVSGVDICELKEYLYTFKSHLE